MLNSLPWNRISALFLCLGFLSCKSNDDPGVKPEDNRFTKVVLTEGMDEPMELTFLPESRILFVERKGGVKILDEKKPEKLPW